MRERLEKLIKKGIDKHESTIENYVHPEWEFIADYLLENGVVVLPCKVGDAVYVVKPYFSFIQEYQVRGYHLGEFPTLNGHKRKSYLICYHKASSALKHLPIDAIGKTVFFNREEAERALKGETK